MAIFEKFPYTDLHNLNLDWMINQFKKWEAKYAEYDAELNELKTAVEAAQAALDHDEQNLTAAITRLDNAIQALPATIREVVRQEIYPAVEEQLPAIVDAKLPREVKSQLPHEFKDWMDEHFTEPPIDPTMTMAYGVPSSRATGNIFDYLQGLKIEGYTNLQDYVERTEDGAGNWDGTGGYEGASNSMRCHFDVVGGLTYRLSGWHPAGLAPTIEDIVFGQGPIVSGAKNFTPVGSIQHDDIPIYRVSANTYDIPIPKGADLLLVNSKPGDGHPYGPQVKGPTFEFRGGSRLKWLSPVTGSKSLKFTDGVDISNALRDGRPVTFRFMASSQFGELYASVAAAKLVREYDLWDIVMLSDNDQLIKARLDTSAMNNGYLRDITVVDLGGDPGPAPVVNFSIVVNLMAGQNNTFTGDITLEDLQSALDDAESVWLSYPGATANDYDMRQVVEYNQDLTDNTSLRIGVFSEDEYIVYSVVDDGNDGVTLTVVSEKGMGGYYLENFAELSRVTAILMADVVPKIIQAPNTLIKTQGSTTYSGTAIQDAINAMKRGKTVFIPSSIGGFVIADSYSEDTVNNEIFLGFNVMLEDIEVTPGTTVRITAKLNIQQTTDSITIRGLAIGAVNTQ